jgi:predicted thioredoxin/glutaredoxin
LNGKGEKVKIKIKKNGQEIIVMTCLNQFDEKVSQKTKIQMEESISLHFDGKLLLLRVVKKNEIHKAVSGRLIKGNFDYSKKRQAMKDEGPIPE